MRESHPAFLSLGSNIDPGTNLPKAIEALAEYGRIVGKSGIWESEPVGGPGPNYWNLCLLFESPAGRRELKEEIIGPIESKLGRVRSSDKYAPRTIDIDIILFNGESVTDDVWDLAFVVVPLAEIHPDFQNPTTHESLHETARRLRRKVWLRRLGEQAAR